MPLEVGSTLGAYEVLSAIGAGGMGEVYKARDTKLDRDVALKILPDAFVNDPERLARFQREAKVLAALNHPNIAAIHGLEESGGSPALVLEYVEGPTLQERIRQGPIPLDEALPIARQIAEALEAAHERGIIHRDLKPANVKVKDDGTVKVLDFGLAKALAGDAESAAADANSPTMTMTAAATQAGVIMGTAAYMAPEQAKGRQVDKRADIWAFGVVLYEMLTGRQAFGGTDISETLASVLKSDLDLDALSDETPRGIRRLISRCMQKDRTQRSRDIGDVRLDLDEALAAPVEDTTEAVTPGASGFWSRPVNVLVVAAAFLLGGLAVWMLARSAPTEREPTVRTSIVLPQTQVRTNTGRRGVAISPLGTHVAYVADSQLYVRALDEGQARPLAGTEGSAAMVPTFSPDGQWIAFYAGRDDALKRVALSGGAAVTLTEIGQLFGASWGPDDTILIGRGPGGIHRVSSSGGVSEQLIEVESPARAAHPQLLPGGEAVLFTRVTLEDAQVVVGRLATGERTVLIEGADGRYLPSGHLIYVLDGTVFGVPFDVERLEVTGGPVSLVEGIQTASQTGAAQLDVARNGTAVYLPDDGSVDTRTLVWVDREGAEEPLASPPRTYTYPRLSPDDTRVVLDVRDEEQDLWVWDLERGAMPRLTFSAANDSYPVWTPDGERIVFGSNRDGTTSNLYWRAADGTGQVERLTESQNGQVPEAVSPDGARLVYRENPGNAEPDLYVLDLDGERRGEPLVATAYTERNADISPDGRWLSYESDSSGRFEVYVRPFPDVDEGGLWQVSTGGGRRAVWVRDGRELFYLAGADLMSVAVETVASFTPGPPRLVLEGEYFAPLSGPTGRTYDVSRDGTRFLMIKSGLVGANDPFGGLTQIHVVQNWFTELQARVSTGR